MANSRQPQTGLDQAINTINNELPVIKSDMQALRKFLQICSTCLVVMTIIITLLLLVIIVCLLYTRPHPAPDILDKSSNNLKYDSAPDSTITTLFQNPAISNGLTMAIEGEKTIAYVPIDNEVCPISEPCVTCELVLETTSKKTKCLAQNMTTNQYEISYQPTSRGRHQLHIKVEEEHIKGSPFNITVIRKIGAPVKTIEDMAAPQGIAFNQRNEKIVAEYQENRIAIISPSLDSVVKKFGKRGEGDGQFYHPCGVAVDDDGNILVADQKNSRIQKFNSRGKYITKVNGNHETRSLELGKPVGIGIHPHTKKIYVTDNEHHRVQILHPNLSYSGSFGSSGKEDGLLNQPKDVAFDSAGNVYVVDNENHRIQVFSETGQYLRKFGHFGKAKGELNYPTSISIDSDDVIYVTELHNNRVSMFTLQGGFLHSFGSKGNGEGEFIDPRGIKVDKNGTIYVSDHGNDRIQVF